MEDGSIRLVEMLFPGRGTRLGAIGEVELPPGCFLPSGEIAEMDLVCGGLEDLIKSCAPESKSVVTAVHGGSVFIRQFSMPVMPDEELASAVHWEAENYLSMPADSLEMDYAKIKKVEGEGNTQYSILLAAATKGIISQYIEVFSKCGLVLSAVEPDIIVLTRLPLIAGNNYSGSQPFAIVDVDNLCCNMVVMVEENLDFCRVIPLGLEASLEGHREEEETGSQIDNVVGEIDRSLNYYRMHSKGGTVERIFVTGKGALSQGLLESISAVANSPAEVLDLRVQTIDGENSLEPRFAVAAGLALREVPQKK